MTAAEHRSAVPTVVYAVDPLCGWCFAIGDEVRQARAELGDSVRWEVALGGLVVGDRVRPIGPSPNGPRAGASAPPTGAGWSSPARG